MGLDMYLYGVNQEFNQHDYNIGEIKKVIEIGYWRKANAIHAWFVNNCQDGIDNCAIYYVDQIQLAELKSLCEEVLRHPNKGPELLPTQEGFFFGVTEYNEFYIDDIKETIEICKWALNENFDYFEYQSSW